MEPGEVAAIMAAAGLFESNGADATFMRHDGTRAPITHRASVAEVAPLPMDARLVVQVSRWDRLKDPLGVMEGFATSVAGRTDAHLVLAGPATEGVSDDPEGAEVLEQCVGVWSRLPAETRARVHLACLPMEDVEENAAIVNALQRSAMVGVQKSLAEGFGLTVAEAMWKGRPVVASRVGAIQDQVTNGVTGFLLDDPRDLAAFGDRLAELLDDPPLAAAMGHRARLDIRDRFLTPRQLIQDARLLAALLGTQ
jgi:trehalose synthase